MGRRLVVLAAMVLSCAHEPTVVAPAPVVEPVVVLPPLPPACQDLLPLQDRDGAQGRAVGELLRLLQRINPQLVVAQRECQAGDSWPIAYATGESAESGKPPMGFEVLRMTGDALLTFDERDRQAPLVNLCRVLDITLGPAHRLRVVALWDSGSEGAFDAAHPEASTAQIAWLELLTRTPSACALGTIEEPGRSGDGALQQRLACAQKPLVLAEVPACAPMPEAPAAGLDLPRAPAIDEATAATHRTVGVGRRELGSAPPPPGLELRLVAPERCLHEPLPAARDVCLAVYQGGPSGATGGTGGEGHERWYGRGEVTRTGTGGVKNYVDSYLTFLLLRRIEAERKARPRPPDAGP